MSYIELEAEALAAKYGTRDPFEIARQEGIAVYFRNDFTKLKGMNPQYNTTGGTSWAYTPTRAISLGIDINF